MNTQLAKLKKVLLTSDGKGQAVKEEALAELIAICEHEAFDKGVEYATVAQLEVQKRIKNFKRERKLSEPVMAW
jgi:hypothetical protein